MRTGKTRSSHSLWMLPPESHALAQSWHSCAAGLQFIQDSAFCLPFPKMALQKSQPVKLCRPLKLTAVAPYCVCGNCRQISKKNRLLCRFSAFRGDHAQHLTCQGNRCDSHIMCVASGVRRYTVECPFFAACYCLPPHAWLHLKLRHQSTNPMVGPFFYT